MAKLAALLMIVTGVGFGQSANIPSGLHIVVVRDSQGQIQGMFQTLPQVYKPGLRLPFRAALPKNRDLKTEDGLVVNGFGFYAWDETAVAHIRVFALVPAPGVENKYLWTGTSNVEDLLQLKPFAEYKLAMGEKREIMEMKKLGLPPMTIELDSKVPAK